MSDLFEQLLSYGDQLEEMVPPFMLQADPESIDGEPLMLEDPFMLQADPESVGPEPHMLPADPSDPVGTAGGAVTEGGSKIWWWLLGLSIPILILLAILVANRNGGNDLPVPDAESTEQSSAVDQDPGDPDADDPDADDPDAGDPDAGDPDAGDPDAGEPEPDGADEMDGDADGESAGESDAEDSPDTENDDASESADSPAADEAVAEDAASSSESGSCAQEGPVDLTVQANAGDSLTLNTEGFTMREPTDQSIPITIIDGGSGPCVDLTAKYTLGDTATTTLLVSVHLPGNTSPNAYTRSYDLQTIEARVTDEQLAYATVQETVVDQLILFDGAPPFYEDAFEEYGIERDSPVGDTRQWIVHKSNMVLGYQSSRADFGVSAAPRPAMVPLSAVGVGAVWETASGSGGRYELVDVTDDVATLSFSSEDGFGRTVGTLWLDLNNPLLSGMEFHTYVNTGGAIQENFITVNGPPCREYKTISANRPVGGLTVGNTEARVLEHAACGLGESTGDSGWFPCQTAVGSVQRKVIQWGDFALHFELGEGEGVFMGWTFELQEQPANEGPQLSTIEFPAGTALGASIADVAAALGVAVEDEALPSARGSGIEFAATDDTGVAKIVGVPAIPSACG